MAYLGFSKDFSRRLDIASATNAVRQDYTKAHANAIKEGTDVITRGFAKAKEDFGKQIPLPTAESSAEEKELYREYIGQLSGQIHAKAKSTFDSAIADGYKQTTERMRNNDYFKNNLSETDIEGAILDGWSDKELHTGVLDAFNKTADARATALGITRFRGTDGAMGTLGSIGSLLYKDNSHLSGKAQLAIGGVASAGLLGAAYAAGNPDNWK